MLVSMLMLNDDSKRASLWAVTIKQIASYNNLVFNRLPGKNKEWPLVVAMGSARDPREVREGPREVREAPRRSARGPRRSATQSKLPKTLIRPKISYQKP